MNHKPMREGYLLSNFYFVWEAMHPLPPLNSPLIYLGMSLLTSKLPECASAMAFHQTNLIWTLITRSQVTQETLCVNSAYQAHMRAGKHNS